MSMSMNRILSVGVVGLGYWGPNHARIFNNMRGCRLGALCDLDPDRIEKMRLRYPDTPCFVSFNQMLEDVNLDAVVVATPVRQHFSLGKAALLAGKHVLMEKPMASSTAECEELIALAASRGLTLMVGHIFVYSTAIQMIRKIIDSQYAVARKLLEDNRDKVEAMARALLELETIDADQIADIMAGRPVRPPRPTQSSSDPSSGGTAAGPDATPSANPA